MNKSKINLKDALKQNKLDKFIEERQPQKGDRDKKVKVKDENSETLKTPLYEPGSIYYIPLPSLSDDLKIRFLTSKESDPTQDPKPKVYF